MARKSGARKERRRRVERPGPKPMIVVAGLPQGVLRPVLDRFSGHFPDTILVGAPAKAADGPLYPPAYLETVLRSASQFAVRRRGRDQIQPSPASISLYFVPAFDQERLIEAFDFFAMPVSLAPLDRWDQRGLQLRHVPEEVFRAMVAAYQPSATGRVALTEVVRRLGYASDNESLLLPPENYLTDDGRLESVFREFRNGQRLWSDRLRELGPMDLTHNDVPNRIKSQQTRHPFVDSRGVAYFIAHPTAYDGTVWHLQEDADADAMQLALRSLYRFGGALPQGLHHDAQRSDGTGLGAAEFTCAEKGQISSTAQHANVFPNDYVRANPHQIVQR